MQDSDQQYPLRQPQRNGQQPSPQNKSAETAPGKPMQPERTQSTPPSTTMRDSQGRSRQRVSDTSLPQRGLWYALIAGAIAGVLSILLSIAITLVNASTFARQNKEIAAGNLTVNTAAAVAGLGCLTFFIYLIAFFITGYIVGRIAVHRRLGFLAGALAGVILYLISFLTRYIPNYPSNTATSGATNAGTIGLAIVFVLISAIIGGLVSLSGTWLATRQHPYYAA